MEKEKRKRIKQKKKKQFKFPQNHRQRHSFSRWKKLFIFLFSSYIHIQIKNGLVTNQISITETLFIKPSSFEQHCLNTSRYSYLGWLFQVKKEEKSLWSRLLFTYHSRSCCRYICLFPSNASRSLDKSSRYGSSHGCCSKYYWCCKYTNLTFTWMEAHVFFFIRVLVASY